MRLDTRLRGGSPIEGTVEVHGVQDIDAAAGQAD
jgi:hypothetical protein